MPCDYSKYPPNWHTEIRPRIIERAENRCEFCNVENHQLVFRGFWHDEEVYQYADGKIYSYPSGVYLDSETFGDVEPISGNGDQKAVKIVLTIAHLDHDEENHNVKDERLAALCQKCHLRYDAPEKERRKREKKYKSSLFPI
jgi:hypothetical protein